MLAAHIHAEALGLQHPRGLLLGGADHVGRLYQFLAAGHHVLDLGSLRHRGAGRGALVHNVAVRHGIGVAAFLLGHGQAQLLSLGPGLLRRHVVQVGHRHRFVALGHHQVHLGALGRLARRILADNQARLHIVVEGLAHHAHLETGPIQLVLGIGLGLARHVGHVHHLARGRTAGQGEGNARDKGHGQHGHQGDNQRLLALLRRGVGIAVVRGLEAARGAGAACAAVHDRHGLGTLHRRHAAHDSRGRRGVHAHRRPHHLGAGAAEGRAGRQGDGPSGQVVVQGHAHVVGRGKALGGVLRQGHHDDVLEIGVDIGVDGRRRRRLVLHLLEGHRHRIGTVEGQPARGSLVQHNAQRVNVAGGGEVFALGLFRGNVVGGAQHGRGLVVHGILRPGNAEVHHLHVAVGLHHDVLRLDVAMDDVLVVGHGEGLAHLGTDFGGLALVDGATLLDGGLQIASAHEFHDNEVGVVVMAPVVHVHNVGALEVRRGGGLLTEALGEGRVGCELRQHHLHGHHASQRAVLGPVHLGHAADADAVLYLVTAIKDLACHGSLSGHCRCSLTFHGLRLRCCVSMDSRKFLHSTIAPPSLREPSS